MFRTIFSLAAVAVMSASTIFAVAEAGSILAGPDSFASIPNGSLAWAGEDETYVGLTTLGTAEADIPEGSVDFVAGIAAPEPPAVVLAGMAIGGVCCGRSLLRKRQPKAVTTEDRS